MKTINKSDLKNALDDLEKQNFDDAIRSSLYGKWKEVWYHKGFESCICCLKDIYKIDKNVDIFDIMRYL